MDMGDYKCCWDFIAIDVDLSYKFNKVNPAHLEVTVINRLKDDFAITFPPKILLTIECQSVGKINND